MRQIGSLAGVEEARKFSDYLLAKGIANTVEEGRDGWAIWVENDDQLEQASQELEEFARNPAGEQYRHVGLEASAIRAREERREKRLRRNYIDVRTSWAFAGQMMRPVTMVLVVLSLGCTALYWFAGQQLVRGGPSLPWKIVSYLWISSMPLAGRWQGLAQVAHGQIWRLVTPIFIHMTVIHLLFNLLWLVDLGAMIERGRGGWLLVGLVLITAVVSNLAQYFWGGAAFGGMSGVIYGLFGYAWMKSRYRPDLGLNLNPNTTMIMLVWLVLCMVGVIPHVANAAHVAGLAVGVVAGRGGYWWRRGKRWVGG